MSRAIGAVERERRGRVVASWRRSGKSAAEFGRRHGLSQWTLYTWARQVGSRGRARQRPSERRLGGPGGAAGRVNLLPVRLVAEHEVAPTVGPAPEAAIEVRLRTGEAVRVVGEVPAERVRAVVAAVLETC